MDEGDELPFEFRKDLEVTDWQLSPNFRFSCAERICPQVSVVGGRGGGTKILHTSCTVVERFVREEGIQKRDGNRRFP